MYIIFSQSGNIIATVQDVEHYAEYINHRIEMNDNGHGTLYPTDTRERKPGMCYAVLPIRSFIYHPYKMDHYKQNKRST